MKAEILRELVESGRGLTIPAGKYLVVLTSDMASEGADWALALEDGPVELPSGLTISAREYVLYNGIMDSCQFEGFEHGFHYGIHLWPEESLAPGQREFLLAHGLAVAHEVELPSVLVYPESFHHSEGLGLDDETVFALVSRDGSLDLYELFQELTPSPS